MTGFVSLWYGYSEIFWQSSKLHFILKFNVLNEITYERIAIELHPFFLQIKKWELIYWLGVIGKNRKEKMNNRF